LCAKEAYFETDYVVVRRTEQCAVARVHKEHVTGLFSVIEAVDVIAGVDSCRWVDDFTVDTGNPSALAEKARAMGVTASETLVVNGLYEHVNFIHRPQPVVVRVFDLSPPNPPRLLDMARQVVAYRSWPAVLLDAHIQSIPDLVRHLGDTPILFPCGISQLKDITQASYLDERPPRENWVLVGCERSRQIHRHIYGEDCPGIELCPRKLFAMDGSLTLMRCCMVENGFELSGRTAVVPWGADRSIIENAFLALLGILDGAVQRSP